MSDDSQPEKWIIPGRTKASHYKRINIPKEEMDRLADIGGREMFTAFGAKCYYTQAIIVGGMLSGDYDKITVVSCWQYGKSYTVGHASLLLARTGIPVYIGANTSDLTSMIMGNAYAAVRDASPELKRELIGDDVKKVDKIGATLSRQRIGYVNGGAVEAITLGGMYQDTEHNKALGKGGAYILDEAALIPDSVHAETLRSDFARTDGKKYLQVAISNPHSAGWFYDDLTVDVPSPRHLIIWMDALTAVQDGRWTKDHIIEESKQMATPDVQRYLLCELPQDAMGMFTAPKIAPPQQGRHFLGVDAAYKGKDNICLADVVLGDGLSVNEVAVINKRNWIDGVTSEDIADTITRVYRSLGAELICVDIGQGIWLVEALTRRGINVMGVNFGSQPTKERVKARHYAATNAANLRAEMHIDLQELMEEGKITFTEDSVRAVKDVLPYVTAERRPNGKLLVVKKEIIKQFIGKSPDELDAVLLGVRAAIIGSTIPDFIT